MGSTTPRETRFVHRKRVASSRIESGRILRGECGTGVAITYLVPQLAPTERGTDVSRTTSRSVAISRREFTAETVLALLAGVTITITGCGGTSSSPTSPSSTPSTGGGTTTQQDVTGTVSANHGHIATVTGAQITAGQALVALHIQGNATHDHTIALTADQVHAIGAKTTVSVQSTTDAGHSHTVTFN